ncbi:MAG: class I SAM-dependent methyltransferase, partial [Betaproteobacteria bacterium]|nr:class I SAM-dependent methyltransferase [Betaproteobacteria bacterium]
DAPPTAGALAARAAQRIARGDWPDGYLSEVHPRQEAFVASLAERLHSGALVFIDYGFDEATYYHPQRNQGTLRCHHRHRAGDQPLVWPGLQDITAHVNFDALTEVAAEAGLEGGHVPMAQFLLDAGILEVLSQVSPDDAARYLPLSAEANRLLSPAEMGELFRVAVWGR